MNKKTTLVKYLFLILAGLSLYFTGLHNAFFFAAWLPMIFFLYYFRKENKWYEYAIILLFLFIPKFFTIHGSWHGISIFLEVLATLFIISPFIAGLLVDKFLYKRSNILMATLIFPATYVIIDFIVGFSKLTGTLFSLPITQFDITPLIQVVSITGMEGVAFLIMWLSSTIATLWGENFDFKKAKTTTVVFTSVFCGIILLGGIYYVLSVPLGPTVKVAGISVAHKTDFWGTLIDNKTPKDAAQKHANEIHELNDELFAKSEKVADFGAKIIFWSEADAVIYDEERESFLQRAEDFAKVHHVYFAPSFLVLKYDTYSSENKNIMITPEGKIAYEYEKTISRYPTQSDGIIKTVDTPYGKIASAICFDTDFPVFMRKAGREGVDILLNPKFDTRLISPGHTYSGLYRAVENGFSMVSQVNEGISMAVDYRGTILARQDFFTTSDKTMIADVPIKGRKTIYNFFGDWFVYLNALFLAFWAIKVIKNKSKKL